MRFTLLLLLAAVSGYSQTATFEPSSLASYDGRSHPAELGRISLPENRRHDTRHRVQLAFMRLKSSAQQPGSPIVFLAGGPGVPGIGFARVPVYYDLFEKLTRAADVILLDQRGSGMSSPNLDDCPAHSPFPADGFANAHKLELSLAQVTADCAGYWKSKGIDLTAYNNEENADDIDDLRKALGAAKVSLLGHSYGTELALSYIRRHPGTIDNAVLASTEGPGDHGTQPGVLDMQLRKVSRDRDLFPLFARDVGRLSAQPATMTITRKKTGQPLELVVGDVALKFLAGTMLSNGRQVTSLPALLKSIGQGDYSLFRLMVEALYNDFDSGITVMGRAMDCSAATPKGRLAAEASEVPGSMFSDVSRIDVQPGICRPAIGTFALDPEYFSPLYSAARVLFLSGTLDANTPPVKAERVRWGFPNAAHVVVENGFHETLPAEQVQDMVLVFFQGRNVVGTTLSIPPPRFLSMEDAKIAMQEPQR